MISWPLVKVPHVIELFTEDRMKIQGVIQNPSFDKSIELAKHLTTKYMNQIGGTAKELLHNYLCICSTIDRIKVDTKGLGADITASNRLMRMVAARFAFLHCTKPSMVSLVGSLKSQLCTESGEARNIEVGSWFSPKIFILDTFISQTNLAIGMAQNLSIPKWVRDGMEGFLDISELRDSPRELVQTLFELKKYGLKNATVIDDGLVPVPGNSWVMLDPSIFGGSMGQLISPKTCAIVTLIPRKSILDIGVKTSLHRGGKQGEVRLEAVEMKIETVSGLLYLTREGELDVSEGTTLIPLRELFVREGLELEYLAFVSVQIMRLFDLTTSLDTSLEVPSLPQRPRFRLPLPWFEKAYLPKLPDKVIRDLIIPRLKCLSKLSDVAQLIESELREGQKLIERHFIQREHEHGGYLRPVKRKDYVCPDSVKNLALNESQITNIPEGFTYVRKHKKGNPEKGTVVGYKARKRIKN